MVVTRFFAPLAIAIATVPSAAQTIDQTKLCSRSGLKQVESAFRKRGESNEAFRNAESALRNILASCPAGSDREKLQKQLDTVEEESAMVHHPGENLLPR